MGRYRTELRALLALAFPIVSGHLAQMLVGLIDTVMVGPLGADATAAVGLSTAMVGLFLIFGFGLCVPVHVFVSAAHAAGEKEEASRVLFHGLFITGIFSVGLGTLMHANIGLLDHLGQDPSVVKLAKPFVVIVMWSAVPVMAGACLRNYCEAMGRPWMPFFTLAVMLPINVLLNWLLIYGQWGFPQMGVTGAAVGTFLARTAQVAMLAVFVSYSAFLKPLGEKLWRMRWERLRRMLGVGVPSSLQIFAEAGAFSLMAIFAGMISAKAQAAYQICNTLGSLSFMVPMGLGMATTIRIGYAFGRRDAEGLRRVRTLSYTLIVAFMSVYAALVIGLRHIIPHLFTEDAQVIAIASASLVWTGLFAVSDGTQAVGIALSRGLRDVKIPSLAAAVTYWLVALPLGWTLAVHAGLGAPGLWMGLAVALTLITVFLFFRVRKNLRRYVNPESFAQKPAQTSHAGV